jgi:hypothetical protein
MMKQGKEGRKLMNYCAIKNSALSNSLLFKFLIICFLTISLCGCTIQATCELYNNTGTKIEIIRWRNSESIQPIMVSHGSSAFLKDWSFWSFKIHSENNTWNYIAHEPDNDFISFHGFGFWTKRIFRVQLEADGLIYILKTDQSFPLKDMSKQPDNFPLVPIEAIKK